MAILRRRSLGISLLLCAIAAAGPLQASSHQFEPETYERLLLPLFLPPVHGRYGSEFHTDVRFAPTGSDAVSVYGLDICTPDVVCIQPRPLNPVRIDQEMVTSEFVLSGAPGRFLYVHPDQVQRLSANLRVHDVSRAMLNFGTEIPIVREREFTEGYDHPIALLNVPTDPSYRNTLRIYGTGPELVNVRMDGAGVTIERQVQMRPGFDIFDPAYAEFTDFPVASGPLRVTVRIINDTPITLPPAYRLWAFISVTSNETQMITTITPQP